MEKMKLNQLIGFDFAKGEFVLGTHSIRGTKLEASAFPATLEADVNTFLSRFGPGGGASMAEREGLVASLLEPIYIVIDYVEMYGMFFQEQPVADGEDWKVPIEDIVVLAWETSPDQAVLYTRPGYSFSRPSFKSFDTGIEINWDTMSKAGWNVLARAMKYAAMALARKRDELLRGVLVAGILASHEYNVAGGTITKASIDQILIAQATSGFPVTQALINPGIMMGMGAFTWGNTSFFLPPEVANELLRTLLFMNYGGVAWYTNPLAPTTEVIFSGAGTTLGWHLVRGSMKTASDVDITQKVDRHAMYDAEHGAVLLNPYPLARLRIAP